jgi:Holliday junction DNA helicase RuvA subunit
MIGSLRGIVVERNADSTVLFEVGGVGYLVHVTPRTLAELEPTSNAFMHVYHHIREDAQTLFGFLEKEERVAFDTLIATHGIGPSMAMSILATHSPRALIDIVAPTITVLSRWYLVWVKKLPSVCSLNCAANCSCQYLMQWWMENLLVRR